MAKFSRKTQARNTRNLKYWFKNNRVTIFALGVAILLIFFLGLFLQKRFSTKSRAESLESSNTIIGGQDANMADWGFFVQVFSVDKLNGFVLPCGGSLISPEWILTAAHCVRYYYQEQEQNNKSQALYVKLLRTENNDKYLFRHVVKTYIPEGYFDNGIDDIALVNIRSSEKYNDEIIYLPRRSLRIPENTDIRTAGYGISTIAWNAAEYKNDLSYPGNLKEVELHFQEFSADKSRIIPSEKEIGTCYGDSGGPLVYIDSLGDNYIVGTTMGGVPGCQGTRWFANVQNYLNWITEVTGIPTL